MMAVIQLCYSALTQYESIFSHTPALGLEVGGSGRLGVNTQARRREGTEGGASLPPSRMRRYAGPPRDILKVCMQRTVYDNTRRVSPVAAV